MLARFVVFVQRIEDYLEMLLITQEIGIACVNEKCFDIMLSDIIRIGLLNIEKVLIRDRLLVRTISLFDVQLQFINGCMQVNNNIGLNELLINDLE